MKKSARYFEATAIIKLVCMSTGILIRTYVAVCQSFMNNANRRNKFYRTSERDRDMILRLRQLSVL